MPDPQQVAIRTWMNSYCPSFVTLAPSVALRPGDVVEVEFPGLGRQRSNVSAGGVS